MIPMGTDTKTVYIYARVPPDLKAQVQEYTAARRLSLAQGVAELLAAGLNRADRTDELERRVTILERYAARP
jgi:hypothetical protein